VNKIPLQGNTVTIINNKIMFLIGDAF